MMVMPVLEKNFDIKTYEADKNSELRVPTLMNIFQDCADDHASNLKVGMEHCLEHGLAWVGTAYSIQINKLPTIHEKILVKTWPSQKNKLAAIREFVVYNQQQQEMIKASSQWVLLNFEKKRPVSLTENLPEFPNTPIRAVDTDFPKIAEVSEVDFEKQFYVRYDDIDINGHVNNAVYPLWATESVNDDFRMQHSPEVIDVLFKKEGLFGEMITVLTQTQGLTSFHSIKGGDGRELARLKIVWKKN